jgi:hypothetical protein
MVSVIVPVQMNKVASYIDVEFLAFLNDIESDRMIYSVDELKIACRLSEMVFQIENKLAAHNRTAYNTQGIPQLGEPPEFMVNQTHVNCILKAKQLPA